LNLEEKNKNIVAYHTPVLFTESIDALNIKQDGIYVDATFGAGGHSRGILARLGEKGRLLGFDCDADTLDNRPADDRFTFVRSNFRFISNFLRYYGITAVDGILADLGVSSHHFDSPERGFSFRGDEKLDMRMNRCAALSAAAVLNNYSEERLADVFYYFGEIRQARGIARAVVRERERKPFENTAHFVATLQPFFSREKEKKDLPRVFQALRIEVNGELESLKLLLQQSLTLLKPQGRLAVISYHSLEDRLVKNFLRSGNFEGKMEKDFYGNPQVPFVSAERKAIVASPEEILRNPRARSARLRVGEKV